MRLTRKTGDGCNDGTCPTIYDTDDPELIGVQGATLIDPEALADAGSIPDHEQIVVFPRALLLGYANKEKMGRDLTTDPDGPSA